jgi:glycosyltransferase involved in cell wall biosynthesis
METLKIAMLAPEFLPNWGGAGTYSILLARELSKNDEVHVFTTLRSSNDHKSNGSREIEAYFDDRVKIHLVSRAKENFWYNPIFQFNVARNLPRVLAKEGYDILHSNHAHMPDLGLKLRKLNCNSVTTVHTTLSSQYKGIKNSVRSLDHMEGSERMVRFGYHFLRVLERYYLHKSDNIIFVSDFIRKETAGLVKRTFPRARLIRNGIDLEHFNNVQNEKNNGTMNIMFCGRLLALKGLHNLIKAFGIIHGRNPDTHLTFVGGGNIEHWKMTAKKSGLPHDALTFMGQMRYEDMPGIIRRGDVFVLPSMTESMPLSLLEAMACGRSTVGSRVGGIPEIINHGENGFLVRPGDSNELASRISELVDDPVLRARFGNKARSDVEKNFNLKDMVKETRDMFLTVAGDN